MRTNYEQVVCRVFHLQEKFSEGSSSKEGLPANPEMQMDESLLSVDYFVKQMQEEALRQENTFTELVARVQNEQ